MGAWQQKPITFLFAMRQRLSGQMTIAIQDRNKSRYRDKTETMTKEPAEDLIRYDVMVQEALIGVVRKVLQDAARHGLPGEHHFYITFRSQGPGVKISQRLTEKYPDEMTIVLQHQFWDLLVGEHSFEVGLSFGGVAEKLFVPFDALTGFYDPSVQFGLKFTPDETTADNDAGEEDEEEAAPEVQGKAEKPATGKAAAKSESEKPAGRKKKTEAEPAKSEEPAPEADEPPPPGGAQVVSLEAFRKKK